MRPGRASGRELVGLIALVAVAGAVRFVDLPGRGTWDADQGHDMLVLLRLVRDGTIPLLGPPTSIGEFHHGALYYYLLAPSAFLSGADPTAVVAEIALAGVLAVAVTWWLARSIAGPVAGLAAALTMALSASAIDESTFIWNPNLIALSSAVALAGAWRARTTGRARWWLVAAVGVLVTVQCHVLGIALLPPVVGLWVATWRVTPRGPERDGLLRAGLAGIGIVLLGYLPLAAYELGHGFAETRAALAFIASGETGVSVALPVRLLFVAFRILAWPLTGLLTDGLVIGVVAGVVVASGLAWRAGQASGRERAAARWMAGTLIFGWLVLTFGTAGLSSVTPLPVDHYHAFLDPVVFVALGLGVAAVWRSAAVASGIDSIVGPAGAPTPGGSTKPGGSAVPDETATGSGDDPSEPAPRAGAPVILARGATVAALAILLAWNVAIWPPGTAADGGWPAARTAADRIEAAAGDRTIRMIGLPPFKSTEAYGFPLERDGRSVVEHVAPATERDVTEPPPDPTAAVVTVCDRLFVADCGGPAEDAAVAASWPVVLRLADRWEPAPRRTLSVYLPVP